MSRSPLIKKAVDLTFERLGQRVICQACGATVVTMGDVCSAPLDAECEGFRAYEATRTQALHDVGFFGKERPDG